MSRATALVSRTVSIDKTPAASPQGTEQDEEDLPPLAGEDSDPDPKDAIKTSIKLREAVPAAATAQALDRPAAIQVAAPHLETRLTSQSVQTASTVPEDHTQERSQRLHPMALSDQTTQYDEDGEEIPLLVDVDSDSDDEEHDIKAATNPVTLVDSPDVITGLPAMLDRLRVAPATSDLSSHIDSSSVIDPPVQASTTSGRAAPAVPAAPTTATEGQQQTKNSINPDLLGSSKFKVREAEKAFVYVDTTYEAVTKDTLQAPDLQVQSAHMLSLGFTQLRTDSCIFNKQDGDKATLVVLYEDDMMIAASHQEEFDQFVRLVSDNRKITHLPPDILGVSGLGTRAEDRTAQSKIMRHASDDERKELRADPHMPVITHLSNRLLAYVDSDHSYDPADDRKSYSGAVLSCDSGPIAWVSPTHLSTSSTTAESKLTAMYSVSQLNKELECGDLMVPTEIPEDDIVCEHHVRNSVLHGRMKHIDIADHVSKDWHA